MLETQIAVPPEMAELVRWFVDTVTPLATEAGWSVTVNGGNDGRVSVETRQVRRTAIHAGERRTETRDIRNFRLVTPLKPRSGEPIKT